MVADVQFFGSVLVVEDSPTRIEWFRAHVPHAVFASTPAAAIAAITTSNPDTVFLDFDLGAVTSLGVALLLADAPTTIVCNPFSQ
jgi:CheY-like chemotaxis protein